MWEIPAITDFIGSAILRVLTIDVVNNPAHIKYLLSLQAAVVSQDNSWENPWCGGMTGKRHFAIYM